MESRKLSILDMSNTQAEVPYGTLDLLILKTLDTMGTMHGYAIARRIEQVSGDSLQISQGSIYPALIRLQQEGWITTQWGTSETNRKVKFYSLTRTGRKQLAIEVANWGKAIAFVSRFLETSS
jgi:transcriptional regulator